MRAVCVAVVVCRNRKNILAVCIYLKRKAEYHGKIVFLALVHIFRNLGEFAFRVRRVFFRRVLIFLVDCRDKIAVCGIVDNRICAAYIGEVRAILRAESLFKMTRADLKLTALFDDSGGVAFGLGPLVDMESSDR